MSFSLRMAVSHRAARASGSMRSLGWLLNAGKTTVTVRERSIRVFSAGAQAQAPSERRKERMKTTSLSLSSKRRRKKPITMVTAYTTPSALHVDRAEIDVLLVGDSLAMVELGMNTTQDIGMEEMIHHCKAVSRGAKYCMLVGDMPFGSYEVSDEEALKNAYRFIKEGGMDCVKLEGCRPDTVKKIVGGGVAVMGHIGLTPQAISVIGGFRAQGRTAVKARELVDQALALQDAGCFAIVLECVPGPVAEAITNALTVPTIGIGAGSGCSGQVGRSYFLFSSLFHSLVSKTSQQTAAAAAAVA